MAIPRQQTPPQPRQANSVKQEPKDPYEEMYVTDTHGRKYVPLPKTERDENGEFILVIDGDTTNKSAVEELAVRHLSHLQRPLSQKEWEEARERERKRKIAMIKEEAEKRKNNEK
jgi:hypothetical protein